MSRASSGHWRSAALWVKKTGSSSSMVWDDIIKQADQSVDHGEEAIPLSCQYGLVPRRLEAKWRTRLEKASPCLPTMSRSPSPGCCMTYTRPVCIARCRISVLRAKNRNRGCCHGALRIHEIALNKILRKIWHLPPRSHTAIVHCVAQVDTISNLLNKRFQSFLSRSLSSSSPLKTIFNESSYCFLWSQTY